MLSITGNNKAALTVQAFLGSAAVLCVYINTYTVSRCSDKGRARLWRLAAKHRLHPEHERSVSPSRQAGGRGRTVGSGGQEAAQSGLHLPQL